MRRTPTQCLVLSSVAAAALLGGCRSNDAHEFVMPLDRTGSVSVMNAMTDEAIWTRPVPPGHVMVVDFDRDGFLRDDEFNITTGSPATRSHSSW